MRRGIWRERKNPMPLTPIAIRNAKPRSKPYKLADEDGMYLLIKPDGARYWRFKYRFAGKEKLLALGVYPDVTLAEARDDRDEAKRKLRDSVDPAAERKARKLADKHAAANTFQAVTEEWMTKTRPKWTERHAERVRRSLEADLFPHIGKRPLAALAAPELLAVLRKIEARNAHELRERVQQRASMIFRYAIATGRCERDPVTDLRGAFTSPTRHNYAALGQKDLPAFFAKLAEYNGEPTTKIAIRLLALTFVRTGELRGAHWSEFDLDAAEWRIPAERMKMRQEHIVPLSGQALDVLRELHELTGSGALLFPSRSKLTQPMSENTIIYALYRMGYHSRATGHGFRSTASTILNELGFAGDVIERQLAHSAKNKVRAAYNKAQYLPERARMMQQWADLLDALAKDDKKVIAGKFGKAA
jgi:integrase